MPLCFSIEPAGTPPKRSKPEQHYFDAPARSPELNPTENIWQYMRQNWLSNRVFQTYDDILALSADAWNKLTDRPWTIMSIATRDWATIGHHY